VAHSAIRENLEAYLAGTLTIETDPEIFAHLELCSSCREQVRAFAAQAELLRELRSDERIEPSPDFVAGVYERIEQQAQSSWWPFLLERQFVRRLAFASLVAFFMLSSVLVVDEAENQKQLALAPAAPAGPQDAAGDPNW
jgi:predicted anti-sigma-YlaC factor YlaD